MNIVNLNQCEIMRKLLTVKNANSDGKKYFRGVSDKLGKEGGHKVGKSVVIADVLHVIVKPGGGNWLEEDRRRRESNTNGKVNGYFKVYFQRIRIGEEEVGFKKKIYLII